MRSKFTILAVWCLLGPAAVARGAHPSEQVDAPVVALRTITPAQTDAVLFNPGMGLYLAGGSQLGYQPAPDAWIFQMADIVYFRPVWSDLEEEGPGSGYDAYFQPIFDFWAKKLGKRVAFRVMSESMHAGCEYATPKWVFEQGVPGVRHIGLRKQQQIDPVFWHEKYLQLYCEFVARLGEYLDGREALEYIDIGGIGEWGEMHLGLHIPGRWTTAQLDETGFTPEKYVAAYRQIIDAHAHAFPHTRVFLNVGDYAQINDYAALRGLHFRQDGLTPRGPSADVGNRFFRPYAPRGVICNYEFHSGLEAMRQQHWDLRTTVDRGMSDPISYLNTNILGMTQWEKAAPDVKELFLDAARKIGFRFVLNEIQVPQQFRVRENRPGRLILEHQWTNAGVAPCYESLALEFTLHDQQDKVVASQLYFPEVSTTQWNPGSVTDHQTVMRIPPGMPAGTYRLKVAMRLPEKPTVNIQLGIAGRDDDGRYLLGEIPAVTATADDLVTLQEGFEQAGPDWSAGQGIKLAVDQTEQHSGGASLRVEGTQSDGWNYAAGRRSFVVYPGSKYRLTCWMKVATLQPASLPPYFKLGINDGQGKWSTNITTNLYDMHRAGEWQQLSAIAETPLNAATGQFAVERGTNESPTTVKIWLDDVQLELLEGP